MRRVGLARPVVERKVLDTFLPFAPRGVAGYLPPERLSLLAAATLVRTLTASAAPFLTFAPEK